MDFRTAVPGGPQQLSVTAVVTTRRLLRKPATGLSEAMTVFVGKERWLSRLERALRGVDLLPKEQRRTRLAIFFRHELNRFLDGGTLPELNLFSKKREQIYFVEVRKTGSGKRKIMEEYGHTGSTHF